MIPEIDFKSERLVDSVLSERLCVRTLGSVPVSEVSVANFVFVRCATPVSRSAFFARSKDDLLFFGGVLSPYPGQNVLSFLYLSSSIDLLRHLGFSLASDFSWVKRLTCTNFVLAEGKGGRRGVECFHFSLPLSY